MVFIRLITFYLLFSFYSMALCAQEDSRTQEFNFLEEPRFVTAEFDSHLTLLTTGQITKIIDPLRIEIDRKDIVQLTSLNIPDLKSYDAGPIAEEATNFLKTHFLNKTVRLYQKSKSDLGRQNRLGYKLVHIETKDDPPIWLQGTLLGNGYARVLPMVYNTEMADEMLDIQSQTAQEKIGLWSKDTYKILTPENAPDHLYQWGSVEGVVTKVAVLRNIVFLNFGERWQDDFTIGIETSVRREFSKKNIDLIKLSGQKIRVHGWLENYNGAYIRLGHPQWLEILETD